LKQSYVTALPWSESHNVTMQDDQSHKAALGPRSWRPSASLLGPNRATAVNEHQALVRGVVLVILDVEGDQRVTTSDADRRDPGVVDRVGVAALLGSGLDVAPGDGYTLVEG